MPNRAEVNRDHGEDMQKNASFVTMLEHPSILERLHAEISEALRDFRQGPKAYITSAIKGDATGGNRRTTLFRLGLAIGILFYAIVFAATLVFWSSNHQTIRPASQGTVYVGTPRLYTPTARMPEGEDSSG